MPHRGTDARRQRREQLDVRVAERNAAASLHRENAERPRSTEHRHSGEHGEFFLTARREMTVAEALLRDRHRNRASAFDDGSGDSFADRAAALTAPPFAKPQ